MKKKIAALALTAFAFTAFTACSNEGDSRANDQTEAGTDVIAPAEADTSITLDPDTTTEHEMAL
jgi:ABC-type oligopeptide transport system substrate-binding subunit